MQNQNLPKLIILAVAAVFGVLAGVGYQAADTKIGVVDISDVVEQSDFGKKNQEDFKLLKDTREGILEFIDTYRVLTNEQAIKLRDLSLKANRSAAETAELETLKATIIASDKKSKELAQKATLTVEERTLMQDYSQRSQTMEQVAQRWFREFTNEMQTWADKQKAASIERARAAINEVGKAGGYTILFESGVAPYGANDVTQAALKAMNAKK